MRERKFRGKPVDGIPIINEDNTVDLIPFAKGGYCEVEGKCFIIPDDAELAITQPGCKFMDAISGMVEVIPETVGDSTGLKDKNGKEIYEEDIVKYVSTEGQVYKHRVAFHSVNAAWYFGNISYQQIINSGYFQDMHLEIIGDIYTELEKE